MKPQIRYCRTRDGVNIAYTDTESGYPFVYASPWIHLTGFMERYKPNIDSGVAAGMRFVVYDGRGAGLSDRNAVDFSLESFLADLDAVLNACELKHCCLIGAGTEAPTAIEYARRFPDRVSHLILLDPYANGEDAWNELPHLRGLESLREMVDQIGWRAYVTAEGALELGVDRGPMLEDYVNYYTATTDPSLRFAFAQALRSIDVTSALPDIAPPTLVVTGMRGQHLPENRAARRIAASIPRSRLVVADGPGLAAVLPAIAEFMLGSREKVRSLQRRTAQRADGRPETIRIRSSVRSCLLTLRRAPRSCSVWATTHGG